MIKFTTDLDILHIRKHRAKRREVLQPAVIMQTLMHSNMYFPRYVQVFTFSSRFFSLSKFKCKSSFSADCLINEKLLHPYS